MEPITKYTETDNTELPQQPHHDPLESHRPSPHHILIHIKLRIMVRHIRSLLRIRGTQEEERPRHDLQIIREILPTHIRNREIIDDVLRLEQIAYRLRRKLRHLLIIHHRRSSPYNLALTASAECRRSRHRHPADSLRYIVSDRFIQCTDGTFKDHLIRYHIILRPSCNLPDRNDTSRAPGYLPRLDRLQRQDQMRRYIDRINPLLRCGAMTGFPPDLQDKFVERRDTARPREAQCTA